MAQVLDYSAGTPGALAIARGGYVGAVRYIGFPARRKCTTRAELEDFSRNGLGMALVYQDATGDALQGRAEGRLAAARARAHADTIGFPAGRPIFFAVDRDITNQMGLVREYLAGAAQILGGGHVGVYGEADVVQACVPTSVAYGWQTVAWSRGERAAEACLFQRAGQVFVGGIQCDVNDVLRPDWGQHNYLQEDDMYSDGDREMAQSMAHRLEALVKLLDNTTGGPDAGEAIPLVSLLEAAAWRLHRGLQLDATLPSGLPVVDNNEALPMVDLLKQIAADLAELKTRPAADVDEAALATQLGPLLARVPDDQIAELIDRIPAATRQALADALAGGSNV